MYGSGGKAFHAPLQNKGCHTVVLLRAVEGCEDEKVVGDVGQADPDFRAVEDVGVAVFAGCCRDVAGVGTGSRLGQSERGKLLSSCLRSKVLLLLLFRAPLEKA